MSMNEEVGLNGERLPVNLGTFTYYSKTINPI
jgi:hypothetical protein